MTKQPHVHVPQLKQEVDKVSYERMKAEIAKREEELRDIRSQIHDTRDSEINLSETQSFLFLIATERRIASELQKLKDEFANSTIAKKETSKAVIGLGDFVELEISYSDGDLEHEVFKLVSTSPKVMNHEISVNGPIGEGILKKQVGDVTNVNLPDGSHATVKILSKK